MSKKDHFILFENQTAVILFIKFLPNCEKSMKRKKLPFYINNHRSLCQQQNERIMSLQFLFGTPGT